MADTTTTEDTTAAGTESLDPNNYSGGSSPAVFSIPGSFIFAGQRIEINKIFINGPQFVPTRDIPLKKDDLLVFSGSGLNLFDSLVLMSENANSNFQTVLKNSERSNNSVISFKIPDLSSSVSNGSFLWLKLANTLRPQANRIIAPYVVYTVEDETEEDKEKKRKAKAAGQEELQGDRTKGPGPTGLIMEAMEDTIGGIATALKGQSQPPSLPTTSTGGTAGALAVQKTDSEKNVGLDFDSNVSEEVSPEGGGVSSTVNIGGQTISQGGTVTASTAGQVSGGGTVQINQNVQSGGTVSTATSVQGSGGGTVSGTTQVSGGSTAQASGRVNTGGTAQVTQNMQAEVNQEAGSGGEVSGSVNVQGSGGSTGQVNQKTNISASSSQSQKAQVSSGAAAGASAEAESQTAVSGQSSGQATSQRGVEASGGGSRQQGSFQGQSQIDQGGVVDSNISDALAGEQPATQDEKQQAPLPGKGNVDGIGQGAVPAAGQTSQMQSPTTSGTFSPTASSIPQKQSAAPLGTLPQFAQKVPQGTANLNSLPIAPPKGMEGTLSAMLKNQAAIGAKLNLPQKNKADKINIGGAAPQVPARAVDREKDDESEQGRRAEDNEGSEQTAGEPAEQGAGAQPPLLPNQQLEKNDDEEQENNRPTSENQDQAEEKEEQNEEELEQEEQADEDNAAGAGLQNAVSNNPASKAAISKATEEAVVLVNTYINGFLLDAALWLWTFAIPSFGLTILFGAIAGDFLWYFKDALLNSALKRVNLPLLKGDTLQKELGNIKGKIKFNAAVKINIALMNLVVVLVPLAFIIFIVVVACNDPGSSRLIAYYRASGAAGKATAIVTGNSDICAPFDLSKIISGNSGAKPTPTPTTSGTNPNSSQLRGPNP